MDLAQRRRFFAEELDAVCALRSPGLLDAFATVPRERFLPAGPWEVLSVADYMPIPGMVPPPRTTPDADPGRTYHNVGIAIDAGRRLFNGHPGTLATWIDALQIAPGARVLHIGAGLGYYTAIMATMVGDAGRVVAVEIDDVLAGHARENLASMPWVELRHGDGTSLAGETFDAILVNAGVTHPRDEWLDALGLRGRMMLPVTATVPQGGTIGKGYMMLVARDAESAFSVRIASVVAIFSAIGLRDDTLNQALQQAMTNRPIPRLTRLRRDRHDRTAACWLHAPTICLSAD